MDEIAWDTSSPQVLSPPTRPLRGKHLNKSQHDEPFKEFLVLHPKDKDEDLHDDTYYQDNNTSQLYTAHDS